MKRRLVSLILILLLLSALTVSLFGCAREEEKISSLSDVNQSSFRLGTVNGTQSEIDAESLFPNAEKITYSSIQDGAVAVKAGKLDGFTFTVSALREFVKEDNELAILDETFGNGGFSVGAAKGNEELISRINDVIKALREDGTITDMAERWLEGSNRTMPALTAPEHPEGTLRILTEGLLEPFTYIGEGGKCIGFDIEMGIRIAYALNMDYTVETMPFDALFAALQSGKGDVILCTLSATDERREQILFSDNYITAPSGVLVRKDRYEAKSSTSYTLSYEEITAEIREKRLGVVSGSLVEMDAKTHYPNAEIYDYPTLSDILAALDAGKIDYALLTDSQAVCFTNKRTGEYSYCTTALYGYSDSFAVTKSNEELLSNMNAVIGRLLSDGTIKSTYEKWLSGDYTPSEIPEIEGGPVLTVALTSVSEPISFLCNNEFAGFDSEIIRMIAYELGMKAEFLDVNYGATVAAVASGKADIAPSLAYTEERAKEVSFTDPYYDIDVVAVKKNDTSVSESASLFETLKDSFTGTFLTENRYELFLSGIGVTVLISVGAYLLGTVLGLLLCLMLGSKRAIFRRLASGYAKIVTGIPILVWLMILYYILFRSVDIDGILVAIIGFGLESAASLSGIFKTGIDSVDKGQMEAAYAMGFLPLQAFLKIELPQAAMRVFDLYKGTFVSLVKSTSIVGYIAIVDLTKVSDIVRSRTYQAFFPLITTALLYFAITGVLVALLTLLQKKQNPRNRKSVLKGVKLR